MASGRGTNKQTCRKCNRTVYVVTIEGARIETDPELLTVVPFETSPPTKIMARRSHSEMCVKYQSDRARLEAQQLAKRTAKADLKKPLPGKREPGQ